MKRPIIRFRFNTKPRYWLNFGASKVTLSPLPPSLEPGAVNFFRSLDEAEEAFAGTAKASA